MPSARSARAIARRSPATAGSGHPDRSPRPRRPDVQAVERRRLRHWQQPQAGLPREQGRGARKKAGAAARGRRAGGGRHPAPAPPPLRSTTARSVQRNRSWPAKYPKYDPKPNIKTSCTWVGISIRRLPLQDQVLNKSQGLRSGFTPKWNHKKYPNIS